MRTKTKWIAIAAVAAGATLTAVLPAVPSLGQEAPAAGGSPAQPGTHGPQDREQAEERAQCLRDHGVTVPELRPQTPPASQPDEDGSSATDRRDGADQERYRAAFKECFADVILTHRNNPQAQENADATEQCLRDHGINPADHGRVDHQQSGGSEADRQRFQAAYRACGNSLVPVTPAPTG